MMEESRPARKTLKIMLDSNALFIPFQFKIDIFEELKRLLKRNFEFVLLPQVRQEVQRMTSRGSPVAQKNASSALKLSEECILLEPKEEGAPSTDDLIVQIARKYKYPVFTNDRQLRNRLRDINVPVIYVRQKSRLEIDGRL